MNENENDLLQPIVEEEEMDVDLEQLELALEDELEEQLADLQSLHDERVSISNPESLSSTVMSVVWEQFINQVGVVAGEDFIKENRGLNLDLRKSAHIQTTENFANGKIATHNTKIDYQERYDKWQSKLEHNPDGTVKTHTTRSGREEANLKSGARAPFDAGRPKGSAERGTDMDHTVPAGEIIRDPAANAHLTEQEQIAFANSEKNLNEMDAGQNRSKGDTPMTEWLDNPNKNGQKPSDIFDIDEDLDRQYREKDAEAREEYERVKSEGEERSKQSGQQSRKEEAFRMGGKALRAAIMGLIAELVRKIAQKIVAWLRSAKKSLETFISQIKEAIHEFIANLKQSLLTAGNTAGTAIATAIIGPIVGTIKKVWIFLKQGYKSLKEAIQYIKDNKQKKPLDILMLEVGKIIIAGLTAGGAIVLGEVIEKGLTSIPVFAVQIPLIGSLANILGLFFGALVAGIAGALALSIIDRAIAKKQIKRNEAEQFEKNNQILGTQEALKIVAFANLQQTGEAASDHIKERHIAAAQTITDSLNQIMSETQTEDGKVVDNDKDLDDLTNLINSV